MGRVGTACAVRGDVKRFDGLLPFLSVPVETAFPAFDLALDPSDPFLQPREVIERGDFGGGIDRRRVLHEPGDV